MERMKTRTGILSLALVPFCFASFAAHAYDIASDVMEQETPVIRELHATPAIERKSIPLALFAKYMTTRFFTGEMNEKDLHNLLEILSVDPDSPELLDMIFSCIPQNNAFLINEAWKGVAETAKKNPHAFAVNHAYAQYLLQRQEYKEALAALENCASAFPRIDDIFKNAAYPKQLGERKAVYAKLLALYPALQLDEKERALLKRIENESDLNNDPQFLHFLLISRSLADGMNREKRPLEPFRSTALPYPSAALQAKTEETLARLLSMDGQSFPVDANAKKTSERKELDVLQLPGFAQLMYRSGRAKTLRLMLLDRLAKTPDEPVFLEELANYYIAEKQPAKAARLLERILKKDKKHPYPFYLKYAETLAKTGNTRKTELAYDVLEKIDPAQKNQIRQMRIQFYFSKRLFVKALQLLQKEEPSFLRSYFEGICCYELGKYSLAERRFTHALQLADKAKLPLQQTLPCFFAYGLALEKQQKIKELDQLFTPLLKQIQDNPELENFVGYTFADHNYRLNDAEKYILNALRLDPYSSAILDSAAWVSFRLKKYQTAWDYMKRSLLYAEEPDSVLLDHAADILEALGKHKEALDYWSRAQKTKGDADQEKILQKMERLNNP